MDEFIKIMTEFTQEEIENIMHKAEKKERLTNYDLSFIYHFMKWKEKKERGQQNEILCNTRIDKTEK